jgi:hypothetical protein
MLKIENVEVVGWEHAIRGMRNPKNSWDRSDSFICESGVKPECSCCEDRHTDRCVNGLIIGPNDHKLMLSLSKGGPVHAKYRRMITVYLDITAPLYWWKEFDTYKVGTVANSCSTMHKIHDKEFTLDDFSCEKLIGKIDDDWDIAAGPECRSTPLDILEDTIHALNIYREKFLECAKKPMKEESKRAGLMKKYWWQMIQLLPSSYNQKRTIMLNYEVLAGIYPMRKDHKLDEWHVFCDWIKSLPYSEIITGEK